MAHDIRHQAWKIRQGHRPAVLSQVSRCQKNSLRAEHREGITGKGRHVPALPLHKIQAPFVNQKGTVNKIAAGRKTAAEGLDPVTAGGVSGYGAGQIGRSNRIDTGFMDQKQISACLPLLAGQPGRGQQTAVSRHLENGGTDSFRAFSRPGKGTVIIGAVAVFHIIGIIGAFLPVQPDKKK